MAQLIVTYWRDIPGQITVQPSGRRARGGARRELPLRFTEAIDMCAMRVGARDSDAYLAEWRKGAPVEVEGDMEAEADAALARIDTQYDDERLKRLVKAEGREENAA